MNGQCTVNFARPLARAAKKAADPAAFISLA
jgi:hypothetical protein